MRLLVVLSCLAFGMGAPVASASPGGDVPASPGETVTLITGDAVTVSETAGGEPTVAVRPADETTTSSFTTLRLGDDTYVVPDAVAGLVPDVLDLELFNVTELVAMGYGDSVTDSLPLIVRGPAPRVAGSTPLPSIGATAVTVPKHAAAALFRARAGTKVWLDRKVEATDLDANLTQIGAPQAWAGGLSGAGVAVAVLDTGVDVAHPDLAGKVSAQANFTADPTAADGNGHGTHVASIIAGSGAAAGGARRGVAYGANLLSAKVLGANGSGQASWIIAGMQWAVDQGADIVNMSLGATATTSDDPLAQAVDALSEDALFVVAAGNSGNGTSTIETPGIAASALTVGAAGANGRPPWFSSNGPTRGTYRAKPDLTAPGVNIVGARAGGGVDPYTTLSGTSQATPHVAGAAALLREQHPDWGWQQIKARLMTTADAQIPTGMPYAEGAGLLDLEGATTDPLVLNRGNVDFGYLRYPKGAEPVGIDLTLTNTGTTAQPVHLTDQAKNVYGEPAAADMVTVAPAELTVAPGATEHVTVTLTPANGQAALYNGFVSLTRDGFEPTTLPLSFYAEPPRHDVKLTVLDRHGKPWAGGTVWLGNMNELNPRFGGGFTTVRLDENGQGTGRVAPGPISMYAKVETPAAGAEPATVAFAGSPEVMVDKDISFTIDARAARPLTPATVDGVDTSVSTVSVHYVHRDALNRGSIGDSIYATPEDVANGRVFLQPTRPVQYGKAVVETRWRLDSRRGDLYQLVLGDAVVPDPPVYRVSRAQARDLARLDADYRGSGTYVETWQVSTELVSVAFLSGRELSAPRHRIELVTARPDVRWQHCVTTAARLCEPTTAYAKGSRHSPVWFRGMAPAVVAGSHSASRILLPVVVSDGQHQGGAQVASTWGTQTLRLYRNGVELPRVGVSPYFDSPPEPAMFRLEHTSTPAPSLPIGRQTSTAWTFPSAGQPSSTPRLLGVDYRPNTDALGRLPAWRPLKLDLRVVSFGDAVTVEKSTLRFWASTDQGTQWREATVLRKRDGTFTVLVPGLVARPGQAVSVHAQATAGERTVDQTIIDAYPVRP